MVSIYWKSNPQAEIEMIENLDKFKTTLKVLNVCGNKISSLSNKP